MNEYKTQENKYLDKIKSPKDFKNIQNRVPQKFSTDYFLTESDFPIKTAGGMNLDVHSSFTVYLR